MKCPVCESVVLPLNGVFAKCRNCSLVFAREPVFMPAKEYPEKQRKEIYAESKKAIFRLILDSLEKKRRKGKVLDIGCAYGDFLEAAARRGWNAEGIEIDAKMSPEAEKKGFKIYTEPIEKLKLPSGKYSAVTIIEVLCLCSSPVSLAREACRVLEREGVLIIREFNAFFHLGIMGVFGRIFSFLGAEPAISHNYNFTPLSLKILLERAGFTNIRIINSPPTLGDPYGTGGMLGKGFVSLIKKVYYMLSAAVYFASLRRILAAPSLLVFAEKKK